MHYIVIDGVPVREQPGAGERLAVLSKHQQVIVTRSDVVTYLGVPTTFHEVELLTGIKGWVYAGFLDRYNEVKSKVKIENPTANPYDAEQYLLWDGKVQHNLCGFFCIAERLDIGIPIEWVLNFLKENNFTLMQRVFHSKGLTGNYDLIDFLKLYDIPAMPLNFTDRIRRVTIFTAQRLETIISTHEVIIAISINSKNGRLAKTGIRHWVAVESVIPLDYGGIVEIYNPFGNRYELYGWDEFSQSVGIPNGVMFNKEVV